MAEILGLGITHYPPLGGLDEDMAGVLRWTLQDPDIPASAKDPSTWPAKMREEWGDDEGRSAAKSHREELVAGLLRIREAVDRFDPDVVIIWGDDQYENFKEDVIPPYAVLCYDSVVARPWGDAAESSAMTDKPNIWGETKDHQVRVKGAPDIGHYLVTELLNEGIDPAYAYEPLHHHGLPHAFLNSVLYLDYERKGFPYKVLPFALNCYGRRVISWKGFVSRFGEGERQLDPPSPPPWRFMEVGAATARVLADSPWRVAIIASSSWSHAFTTDKTWRLMPDVEADRELYGALQNGQWDVWKKKSLDEIEASGQQELLNWFALAGAMEELGRVPTWSKFVETYVFNSPKVFAIFDE